jgi:hypothetical protein
LASLIGFLGLLSGIMWALSAFLSGEKMRASKRHAALIEQYANWTNFMAASFTASATMMTAIADISK